MVGVHITAPYDTGENMSFMSYAYYVKLNDLHPCEM